MSKTAVNQVIQRAISDAAYRRQLQRDPGKALTGFDLSKDERAAITSGDPTRLTALGVDQRMSKSFAVAGLGDVSKVVVGDATGSAGGNTFIDEASAASSAAIVSGAVGEGSSGLMAPDGTSFDAGLVSGDSVSTSAVTTDATGANQANLQRIEGDLNTGGSAIRDAHDAFAGSSGSAIRDAHDSAAYSVQADATSANQANLQRIEGDLNTGGSAIRDAHDAFAGSSGSAIRDAHDSAAYSAQADATSGDTFLTQDEALLAYQASKASTVTSADSVNTANLKRIEGDLNTATAFEAQDASGDGTAAFDAGAPTGEWPAATAEDTAADQISSVEDSRPELGGDAQPTEY